MGESNTLLQMVMRLGMSRTGTAPADAEFAAQASGLERAELGS